MNPFKELVLSKIIINSSIGSDVSTLEGAVNHFCSKFKYQVEKTKAKKSVHGFNIRRGNNIGFKIALRKDKASKFLNYIYPIIPKDYKVSPNGAFTIHEPYYFCYY